ncbi:MAG: CDP-glucose 4,6-dehydratase [Nanoarchaeota archaeon]
MTSLLNKTFNNKKVLITGHTGFKGSWLAIWLRELGAEVIGYSLDPPTKPNNFELTNLKEKIIDIRADVRDYPKLEEVFFKYQPEIVFHLAAQAIVLTGFENPRETFDTNVQGTVNLLEVARKTSSVKTMIMITSDKCYKDQNVPWGYRENDTLGGSDPYSASKGMAELAISSYQKSFYDSSRDIVVASVRAGNVIGGGDFANYRIVPDSMKALMLGSQVTIRNPSSIRPWQHVLVPLSGYLNLAAMIQEKRHEYEGAWNFGPLEKTGITTAELADKLIELWGNGSWNHTKQEGAKKETMVLKLNWDKAAHFLKWSPAYNYEEALKSTVSWFSEYNKESMGKGDLYQLCADQIKSYTQKARDEEIQWALDT